MALGDEYGFTRVTRQRILCQPGPQFGSRFPGDPHKLAPLLTDEEAIRQLRDHLEDRFATSLRNAQRESDEAFAPAATLQVVMRSGLWV